jgi:tripartite-type tricarboxylate transporter receptor subunit TctC
VPTIAEAGLPGYDVITEIGFVAPARTPRGVIAKLNSEIVKVLKTPEIARQLIALGMDPIGSTPEEYAEVIRVEIQKFGKLVKMSRAKVD